MSRRQKYIIRHSKRQMFLSFVIGALLGWYVFGPLVYKLNNPVIIVSPIKEATASAKLIITPTNAQKTEATTSPIAPQRPTIGNASYYSVDGCIGCNENRIMANGERLDDTRLTIAYNHAPLNTRVKITNTKTGQTVIATITDRGGFEPLGKIADLSVATRDALGCGSLCPIKIEF